LLEGVKKTFVFFISFGGTKKNCYLAKLLFNIDLCSDLTDSSNFFTKFGGVVRAILSQLLFHHFFEEVIALNFFTVEGRMLETVTIVFRFVIKK
jgi:hypothetical protein